MAVLWSKRGRSVGLKAGKKEALYEALRASGDKVYIYTISELYMSVNDIMIDQKTSALSK